jgi:hypothetical protein
MKEKQNLYVSSVANVKYMTNSDVPYSWQQRNDREIWKRKYVQY